MESQPGFKHKIISVDTQSDTNLKIPFDVNLKHDTNKRRKIILKRKPTPTNKIISVDMQTDSNRHI